MSGPIRFLTALFCAFAALADAAGAGQAEHVVVVVWDGMRPDFVKAQYTPTLNELARRGTFFRNHHSSYVSSTEVNATAIATGMYPRNSGILANVQYRPELSWLSSYGTEGLDAIRRGDLLSNGHYLPVPTLPEILQAAGIPTITAGAKPVVLLHDRSANKTSPAQKNSITLFRGRTLPRSLLATLERDPNIGPFPKEDSADSTAERVLGWIKKGRDKAYTWANGRPPTTPIARRIDAWTASAVINGLWKDSVPKYTLVWLSEPDASQHQIGPDSPNAEAGLESSDRNLARLIQALKDKNLLERTDILVVSDHGFSTVDRGPDVIKALKRAKFVAAKEFDNPEAGDVLVVSLGGSIFFYVFDHEPETTRRLVEFLQQSDFAGVIFSAIPVDGTFPLSHVLLDASTNAPDVVVSMRWRNERNDWGTAGLVTSAQGRRGAGTHASLSPFDLHNTLIAAGPDFKSAFVSELPSGNVDVAPTLLAILGVAPPRPMNGRVLLEAMTGVQPPLLHPEQQTFRTGREIGPYRWDQFLRVSSVGTVVYIDEGNGENHLR